MNEEIDTVDWDETWVRITFRDREAITVPSNVLRALLQPLMDQFNPKQAAK